MTTTDTYAPARAIMGAAELEQHRVGAHGRDYRLSTDGYGDMAAANAAGWHALSCWGRDGYDMGDWPYVVVSTRKVGRPLPGNDYTPDRPYQLSQTCEGDTTVYAFATEGERDAAADYLFIWYGLRRGYDTWQAFGLTEDKREELDAGTLAVPLELRGPYRA